MDEMNAARAGTTRKGRILLLVLAECVRRAETNDVCALPACHVEGDGKRSKPVNSRHARKANEQVRVIYAGKLEAIRMAIVELINETTECHIFMDRQLEAQSTHLSLINN